MISSLTTRARHVCYRKIRKHVETTQQYWSGLARHGNGELAQCGKGEKHQRLLGAVGVGKGQKTSPGTPRRPVLRACHTLQWWLYTLWGWHPHSARSDRSKIVWVWKTVCWLAERPVKSPCFTSCQCRRWSASQGVSLKRDRFILVSEWEGCVWVCK